MRGAAWDDRSMKKLSDYIPSITQGRMRIRTGNTVNL